MQESEVQVSALKKMYEDIPAYRPFFDDLARYINDVRSIKIDGMHRRVGGKRGNVVQAFKSLEQLGLGTYVKGSWGHPSRFDFSGTSPRRVGLLAQGEVDEDELPDAADEEDEEEESESVGVEARQLAFASIEELIEEIKRRGAQEVVVTF